MPIKKGKKAKKGKGKGKKDGRQESKRDKESDLEKAKANAALWEARCDMTESSRVEYYEAARRLSQFNQQLTEQQHSAEKSSIDVIAVLRTKDVQNEDKITALEQQIQHEKTRASQEKENLATEYTLKINELEEKFNKRCREFNIIQDELKIINAFRDKKPHMEQELKNMRESMDNADLEHKKTIARLEQKFFDNKALLEKQAEQKIAVLAERAHNQAIIQLDDKSRSMFKENVRLTKALGYHIREVENLRRRNAALAEENNSLSQHKETSQEISNDATSKLTAQRTTISELRAKVFALEQTLANMVADFEQEKADVRHRAAVRTQAGDVELDKLQKLLSVREKELSRVKRGARSVLEQRSDTEILLHQALQQVKQEIMMHRQEVELNRSRRVAEFLSGRRENNHIHTINKTNHSTNSISVAIEEAEKGQLRKTKVNVSDMTWEQRESVLRLLFAKMNGLKTKKKVPDLALTDSEENQCSSNPGNEEEESFATFLTQAAVSSLSSSETSSALPDV